MNLVNQNSPPQPQDIYSKYQILNPSLLHRPPCPPLQTDKKYIKITVMKSNADNDISNIDEYFVNHLGLLHSEKNTTAQDIIIGRQHITADGIRTNDIVLPASDRAISRVHCKIIY